MSIVEKRKGGGENAVDWRGKITRCQHAACRARLLVALLLAAGCESDQAKYTRLRQDMLASCLAIDPPISGYAPSDEQRAKCAMAERNYNRFMAGR